MNFLMKGKSLILSWRNSLRKGNILSISQGKKNQELRKNRKLSLKWKSKRKRNKKCQLLIKSTGSRWKNSHMMRKFKKRQRSKEMALSTIPSKDILSNSTPTFKVIRNSKDGLSPNDWHLKNRFYFIKNWSNNPYFLFDILERYVKKLVSRESQEIVANRWGARVNVQWILGDLTSPILPIIEKGESTVCQSSMQNAIIDVQQIAMQIMWKWYSLNMSKC